MSALCVLLLGEYGNENRISSHGETVIMISSPVGLDVFVCVFVRAEILELCVAQSGICD